MEAYKSSGHWGRVIGVILLLYLLLALALGIYWSNEPRLWKVDEAVAEESKALGSQTEVGFATTTTLILLAELLLEKPGGYLSNDRTPPGIWLDNMPDWEFGVLVQLRDMSRALRKDLARSQSTSQEDPDLAKAEPHMNFDNNSFMFPSTEAQYREGIRYLRAYQRRLADDNANNASFYARADNLRSWLEDVETRLGSLSQKLSASVGKDQINVDLAGDYGAQGGAKPAKELRIKTPWLEIDNVFYEARGAAFALIHLMKAVETDFGEVLTKKNATVSLQQIVRELEASQQPVRSPLILNGTGFGLFANHSLVMANYLSRATAAIIDLRRLLEQG